MGREAAPRIDKREVLERLRERLAERLESLVASQKSSQSGAVHSEARQEHAKDTRATEQAYLARGLAERVETLREAVAALAVLELRDLGPGDAVGLGALVGLRDDDGLDLVCFLSPAGAGERLDAGGASVLVVTPHAPLGRSLVGARVDDAIEVELPERRRWFDVGWVR